VVTGQQSLRVKISDGFHVGSSVAKQAVGGKLKLAYIPLHPWKSSSSEKAV